MGLVWLSGLHDVSLMLLAFNKYSCIKKKKLKLSNVLFSAKLLRNIRPHFSAKRNESTQQSPCGDQVPAAPSRIRSPFRSSIMAEHLDRFLDTKSIHVNILDYAKENRIPANCPIHKMHAGQLGANTPIEDRWNCSFTGVYFRTL